jgi:hypothetical protein
MNAGTAAVVEPVPSAGNGYKSKSVKAAIAPAPAAAAPQPIVSSQPPVPHFEPAPFVAPVPVANPDLTYVKFTQLGGEWHNPPQDWLLQPNALNITTEPRTDIWQRTYFGFRMDNAPCYFWQQSEAFTMTIRCTFDYREMFDQCGIILYLDGNNWFKAGVEVASPSFSRIFSAATNFGHTDYASIDVNLTSSMYFRLSRRGADFLVEYSTDGEVFNQLRIFHMHLLGITTAELALKDVVDGNNAPIPLGVFASSPLDSSFKCSFTELQIEPSMWSASPF